MKVEDGNLSWKRQLAHEQWLQDLSEFLHNVVNNLGIDGTLHMCRGASCCPYGKRSLMPVLVAGVKKFVFAKIPSPPPANKWTKLMPALMCVILGIFLKMLHPLWSYAFANLPCVIKYGATDSGETRLAVSCIPPSSQLQLHLAGTPISPSTGKSLSCRESGGVSRIG